MHSRGNSATTKPTSPPDYRNASPLSPGASSSPSVPLDPTNVAAFSNLLPLGNLPAPQSSITSVGHGPISGVHKLPPRPRPGRKADPNPASTKKGQSNRLAQQKHRLKKKQLELQEIERQRKQVEENNRLLRQNAMLLHENKRLKQAHVAPGPLSPALTSSTPTQSLSVAASLSPPPLSHQSPPRPAPGGCGRCVEGGECPCVDSLLETEQLEDHMDVDLPATTRRSPRQTRPSLSIQSLLGPAAEPSNLLEVSTPAAQTHHEHEIDFTTAFRHEPDRNTYDPVMSTGSLTTCGGCPPDDTSCLCNKANRVAGSPAESTTSAGTVAHSRTTSSVGNGPGSCARCQADPKQRAWCQGLALETLGSPISSAASDNEGDHRPYSSVNTASSKRAKQHSDARYETISCAEAYSVQQRLAQTTLGSTRASKRKSTTQISAIDVLNSVRERPREYSAFEVDIGTVLSNLKHCNPRRPANGR